MSEQYDRFVEVVKGYDFVILDTETTGLRDGEICQMAVVQCDGIVLLDVLVKPTAPIPASATAVHGITNDMVEDSPSWAAIAPEVRRQLEGRNIIVYNAKFDRMMLHQSAEKNGLAKVDWKTISNWYCAMEMFAEYRGLWDEYHGNYKWARLGVAMQFFGIQGGQFHTAIDDCMNTLQVVTKMAYNPRVPF